MRSLLLTCLTSLVAASLALAQSPATPALASPSKSPAALSSPAAVKPAAASAPFWKDLSATEQAALRPLGANWDGMSLERKRKWQNVAKDFDKLPAAQQTKMHTRMTEWAALSPQQRANARQNFAQTRELTDGLTSEQRKVQWQAYQQLSPEQKQKLAQSAPVAALPGAAPAIKPQAVLRKEPPPEFGTGKVLAKAKEAPNAPAPGKKIAVAPHMASQGSILPTNSSDTANKP